MSYVEGTRKSPPHYKCDQSGADIPLVMPAGTLILMEVPAKPMRTPLNFWPVYHFVGLEELKQWREDMEQVIC